MTRFLAATIVLTSLALPALGDTLNGVTIEEIVIRPSAVPNSTYALLTFHSGQRFVPNGEIRDIEKHGALLQALTTAQSSGKPVDILGHIENGDGSSLVIDGVTLK